MGDHTYQIPIGDGRIPYLMFIGNRLLEELSGRGFPNLYSFPGNADYYLWVRGARVHLKGDVGRLEVIMCIGENSGVTADYVLRSLQGIVGLENSSFPLGGRPEKLVTSLATS